MCTLLVLKYAFLILKICVSARFYSVYRYSQKNGIFCEDALFHSVYSANMHYLILCTLQMHTTLFHLCYLVKMHSQLHSLHRYSLNHRFFPQIRRIWFSFSFLSSVPTLPSHLLFPRTLLFFFRQYCRTVLFCLRSGSKISFPVPVPVPTLRF